MEDYHKKRVQRMSDSRMEKSDHSAKKKVTIDRATACYEKIEYFVKMEMEKGKTLEEAIKVVENSKSINRTYSQMEDEYVRRLVFRTIRANLYEDKHISSFKSKDILRIERKNNETR